MTSQPPPPSPDPGAAPAAESGAGPAADPAAGPTVSPGVEPAGEPAGHADVESSVARPGGVSYLRIPAPDAASLAGFYQSVFGWTTDGDPEMPNFADCTRHVIGHFQPDLPVAGDAGVRPYIYVERIDEALRMIKAHGGEVTVPPFPEGNLWVALFRDPAGNVIGVWQQGARS